VRLTRNSLPFLILAACAAAVAEDPIRIGKERFLDKCKGARAGQMIGVAFGGPTEWGWGCEGFLWAGRPDLSELRAWKPELIAEALKQDDVYVEMTFLKVLEDYGIGITPKQAGRAGGTVESDAYVIPRQKPRAPRKLEQWTMDQSSIYPTVCQTATNCSLMRHAIKIVAFGDSITLAKEQVEQDKWTTLVQVRLKEDIGREVRMVNAGVGGNTSREGLRRIESGVLRHNPDIVLVEFGGNDATPAPAAFTDFTSYAGRCARWSPFHAQRPLVPAVTIAHMPGCMDLAFSTAFAAMTCIS